MKHAIIRTLTLTRLAIRPAVLMSISLAMFLFAGCEKNAPSGPQDLNGPLSKATGVSTSAVLFDAAESHITVSGTNAGDVAPVVTGGGFINVVNNGAHVAATQSGIGTINIVNNGQVMAATNTGSGVMTINSRATGAVTVTNTGNARVNVTANGGGLTATNTGNGVVTINSTATGFVTVTNTGNGRVNVTATGSAPITLTHTGDDDFTYPN